MTLPEIIQTETDRTRQVWNELEAAEHQTEKLFIIQSGLLKARVEQAKKDLATYRNFFQPTESRLEELAAGLEQAAKRTK